MSKSSLHSIISFKSGISPKSRFIRFLTLIFLGALIGFLTIRKGFHLTPENFKQLILDLGILGPILYIFIFSIRPLFLIPSIALFIGGGLAYGPVWGPIYASLGVAIGGSLGFWIARKMGHEYVINKLKVGKDVLENTRFTFSAVFILSLLPIMPVTVINYGAGLSPMRYPHYILSHLLGMIPRAFAFGFFGNSLLDIGGPKFKLALGILVILSLITLWWKVRSSNKKNYN